MKNGNRLSVPRGIRSNHFFYKTAATTSCSRSALESLARIVKPLIKRRGAIGEMIQVIDRNDVSQACGRRGEVAWDNVVTTLPLFVIDAVDEPEIVGCEWVGPHVDAGFAGSAFYQVVLHTGPYPYRMETFHTRSCQEHDYELTQVVTSSRLLAVGDAFVFDPSTPHMVVPERPDREQMLLLMQAKFADADLHDRRQLLKTIKPAPSDGPYIPR